MITIDGSSGEGGGQILRTALGLSLVTRTPFRIERIRAGRGKPGLLRQHLAAVRAATAIGDADVHGAALGSQELTFVPRGLRGGEHTFEVGSAGSATLVFQTVFPAMLVSPTATHIAIEGGTHNTSAPPFPFLHDAFAPILRRMGAELHLELERAGFYPAGGGRIHARVEPLGDANLAPLVIEERGPLVARRVRAVLCRVPDDVARREIDTLLEGVGWTENAGDPTAAVDAQPEIVRGPGPGNALVVTIEFENVTEVVTGFGERGVRAEEVARKTASEVRAYLESGAPVGEHLADQLVLPMAMGSGGSFRTMPPTKHLQTQIETIRLFLDRNIALTEESERVWRVEVR